METLQITTKSKEIEIQEAFAPFREQTQEWLDKANSIKVTDEGQTDLMEAARKARLALRAIRVAVGTKHGELKADALREGQILDRIKRELVGMIEPIEAVLQESENFKEVQEAKRKKELFTSRAKRLADYMILEEAAKFPLGDMGDEAFENLLSGFKLAREKKKKDEEQLRLDQELKEKVAEKERKLLADENEKLRAEKEKQDKKLQAERAERKRLEDEAEAIRQKEEQRKKDEANAKRKAARQPDKEKVIAFTRTLYALANDLPKMGTEEGEAVMTDVKVMLGKMIAHLNKKSEQL